MFWRGRLKPVKHNSAMLLEIYTGKYGFICTSIRFSCPLSWMVYCYTYRNELQCFCNLIRGRDIKEVKSQFSSDFNQKLSGMYFTIGDYVFPCLKSIDPHEDWAYPKIILRFWGGLSYVGISNPNTLTALKTFYSKKYYNFSSRS